MLEELDNIAWEKLEHAYGPAGNIPALIRDLVSQDHGVVEKALGELFSNIWHQGTVYSASAPAVPFLVQALPKMPPSARACCWRNNALAFGPWPRYARRS